MVGVMIQLRMDKELVKSLRRKAQARGHKNLQELIRHISVEWNLIHNDAPPKEEEKRR